MYNMYNIFPEIKKASMEEEMMRESLVEVLERGKELTMQMRKLIDHSGGCLKTIGLKVQLEAHSLEVLTSFSSALSLLQTCFPSSGNQNLKSPNPNPTPHSNKSMEYGPKDGGGCRKRRKTSQQSLEIETSYVEDGQAWRKYGQKPIQNTRHPRNYYRCTYKNEQECQATKQVQLISENPPLYKIIYHGHHTCNNSLENHPVYFDSTDKQHNSSFLLSFESPNNPKDSLNPFMFQPTPSSSSTAPISPSSLGPSMSNARVEQEHNPIKLDEIPLDPSDYHHGSSPSSSDRSPATSDLTNATTTSAGLTSTPVFDDVISLPEIYSPVVSPHLVEGDYNYVMADSFDFRQVPLDNDNMFCASWPEIMGS